MEVSEATMSRYMPSGGGPSKVTLAQNATRAACGVASRLTLGACVRG